MQNLIRVLAVSGAMIAATSLGINPAHADRSDFPDSGPLPCLQDPCPTGPTVPSTCTDRACFPGPSNPSRNTVRRPHWAHHH